MKVIWKRVRERERRWRKNIASKLLDALLLSSILHRLHHNEHRRRASGARLSYSDPKITTRYEVCVLYWGVKRELLMQLLLSASQARLYCFARALLPNQHHIGHRRFIVAYIMHVNDLSLFFTFWIFGLALWFKWKRKRGKYAAALSAEVILHKVVKIV